MPVLPLVASLDDGPGHAVLDRAHRVAGLDLDVDVDPSRRELAELHEGGIADRLENVFVAGHGCLLASGFVVEAIVGRDRGSARGKDRGFCAAAPW